MCTHCWPAYLEFLDLRFECASQFLDGRRMFLFVTQFLGQSRRVRHRLLGVVLGHLELVVVVLQVGLDTTVPTASTDTFWDQQNLSSSLDVQCTVSVFVEFRLYFMWLNRLGPKYSEFVVGLIKGLYWLRLGLKIFDFVPNTNKCRSRGVKGTPPLDS